MVELKYFIAGAVAPILWAVVLALLLWLCRRLFPTWERALFGPYEGAWYALGVNLGKLVHQVRTSHRRRES